MGTYDVARNKTKTAIIEAFWKLYAEKDISKITVRTRPLVPPVLTPIL